MKKTSLVLVSAIAMLGMNGCGNAPESSPEAKTYSKTPAEVYAESCVKCHGENGEGNPAKKGPALNDRQAGELELDLYDVKNEGTNQSSGTEHEIMAHNMKKLTEKGFDYDPTAMAEYLEKSFYKMEEPEAEEAPESVETEADAPVETPVAEATEEEAPAEENATAIEAAPAETEAPAAE
ncbi:MAG: c-type cytochrome [Sulfurovum sp.]